MKRHFLIFDCVLYKGSLKPQMPFSALFSSSHLPLFPSIVLSSPIFILLQFLFSTSSSTFYSRSLCLWDTQGLWCGCGSKTSDDYRFVKRPTTIRSHGSLFRHTISHGLAEVKDSDLFQRWFFDLCLWIYCWMMNFWILRINLWIWWKFWVGFGFYSCFSVDLRLCYCFVIVFRHRWTVGTVVQTVVEANPPPHLDGVTPTIDHVEVINY